jgi:thiamine-monophosphate kinase
MRGRRRTVSDLGETALIERLSTICHGHPAPDVLVGIGDDAAVLRIDDSRALLATCDIQVENVHFRRDLIDAYRLGRRAIAVNVSDIAAMGGTPEHGLVSLAFPARFPAEEFEEIFRGAHEAARDSGAFIVGGNLSRSPRGLVIDVFLLGSAHPSRILTRTGARPGDGLYVTGNLGASAAGADLLLAFGRPVAAGFAGLVAAHLEPKPRLAEGRRIAASGLATAMIDVSDGLAADVCRICEGSRVGVELDLAQIPVSQDVTRAAGRTGRDPLGYVLHGGEDYELLFTVPPAASGEIERLTSTFDVAARRIGTVLEAHAGRWLVDAAGRRTPLCAEGWDHFAGSRRRRPRKGRGGRARA